MEKRSKVIIVISIVIISITAIIIGLLSPGAYNEQCKHKARELVNNLYATEGNREDFLRSFQQETISTESQTIIENLRNVVEQCPQLRNMPAEELGTDISFLDSQ